MDTPAIFFLQGSGLGILDILPPFIMIFIFYHFMIARPQRARQRALQEMLSNLKIGDKIITTGGIYGTVTELTSDQIVQIRIAESVKINISKNAISALQEAPKQEKSSKESEKKNA
ncbi:MAG: preprotein translocase subunit YajC [Blastocatellia bacterium]|nr:preprotein translocase subunit YajC [Blastocatellia bacterium]